MHCVCKKYDDIDELDSYCEFLKQQEEVNKIFPYVEFTIDMTLDQIDEVVSPLDKIIVKQTFDCYCYEDDSASKSPIPKWFTIHCKNDEKMTNRVIIRGLAMQGFSLDCNHRFLEGFARSSKGGDCQFEPVLGS